MLKLELLNQLNKPVEGKIDHEKETKPFVVEGGDLAVLGIKDYTYQVGDKIRITVDHVPTYLLVQLDETLVPSLLYITKKEWIYELPLTDNLRESAVDTSFSSGRHHLMVRKAHDFEISNYQNLSFNAHDQKDTCGAFPHAFANVETRNESVFFAKNAIDGKLANLSHGSYPFASWGINQQTDAALTIDFGREVEIDRIAFLLRSDFPHEAYWTKAIVVFSDKSSIEINLEKSSDFQNISFKPKRTEQIILKDLKKAEDLSPFPALSQIEVFGRNVL